MESLPEQPIELVTGGLPIKEQQSKEIENNVAETVSSQRVLMMRYICLFFRKLFQRRSAKSSYVLIHVVRHAQASLLF